MNDRSATAASKISRGLSGMFHHNASLAIPHCKSFTAIPSVSLCSLSTRMAAFRCHMNRSVKLPSLRCFQDQFLTTSRDKGGEKKGRACFAKNWGFFLKPQPPHTRQNMNKKMAPKLPNLPCFEAFGVIFCPDCCSSFCLVCGGWGALAYF